jgi:hypothetical protein
MASRTAASTHCDGEAPVAALPADDAGSTAGATLSDSIASSLASPAVPMSAASLPARRANDEAARGRTRLDANLEFHCVRRGAAALTVGGPLHAQDSAGRAQLYAEDTLPCHPALRDGGGS